MVFMLDPRLTYSEPIIDAHTHVVDDEALPLLIRISESYGVKKIILIVHDSDIEAISNNYPGKFIFAKYFSGWVLFANSMKKIIPEVLRLREQGYRVAKIHFAPFWIDRLAGSESVPPVDDAIYDKFFDTLSDEDIPTIIHIGDPDTYFSTRYADVKSYGTKEEHILAFENRLKKNPGLRFQVAHFAAQPECHRLDNLDRMLKTYNNMRLDISSARWMARELGKDTKRASELITKYQDRILFATDCVARSRDTNYYDGRYLALRLLLETDVQEVPLPFIDRDTIETGGTFINGLNLKHSILSKIYFENAKELYEIE